MEHIANTLVLWITNNWSAMSMVAAAIAGLAVFLKNVLAIRKLGIEIDEMRYARNRQSDVCVRIATMEEVEKFGKPVTEIHGDGMSGSGSKAISMTVLRLLAIGLVIGFFLFLQQFILFSHALLALSLLILSISGVRLIIRKREHTHQTALCHTELLKLRKTGKS